MTVTAAARRPAMLNMAVATATATAAWGAGRLNRTRCGSFNGRRRARVSHICSFLCVCVCQCRHRSRAHHHTPSVVHPVWSSSPSTQGKELLSELAYTTPHGPQRELGDHLSLPRQVGIPLFVQVDAVCSNHGTKVRGLVLLDLTQHIVIVICTLLFTFVTALNPHSHPRSRLFVRAAPSAIGIYPQSSQRFIPAQSWPAALTCCGVIILPEMVHWSAGPGLIRLDLPRSILASSLLL